MNSEAAARAMGRRGGRARVLRPAGELKAELEPRLYDLAVDRFRGSFSAEHGIGPHNQAFYDLYTPELVKEVCRLLKQRLDPTGLLGTVRLG